MKVQSMLLLKALEDDQFKNNRVRVVPISRARSSYREPLVLDGPFAESKEGCSHVAILARRRREATNGA